MALGQDTPAAERMTNPLSRSELRKKIGPSNPLYPFLMQLAVQDLAILWNDDFADQAVNTSIWDLDDSASATLLWAVDSGGESGLLEFDPSGTNDVWGRIHGQTTPVHSDHRPMAIFRFMSEAFDSDDDSVKYEMGFAANLSTADGNGADTAGGGQVLLKGDPTSNVNDYSVVILDTDDNKYWDVIGDDDGTTVTSNVSSSVPWNPTQTSDTTAVTDQTTIAFVSGGASADTITDSGTDFAKFATGDVITVTGSVRNNGTYTITTGGVAGTITLSTGELNTEAAGASVTITTPDLSNGDAQWQTVVVAQNENQEAYGWINGHFIARLVGAVPATAGAAPDAAQAQTIHFYYQNRASSDPGFIKVDFIRSWQERVAIS